MFKLIRVLIAYFSVRTLQARHEVGRQIAYDGVSYAEELAAVMLKDSGEKMTAERKLELATLYMRQSLPDITDDQCRMMVTSLVAKVVGVGATGKQKF